MSLWNKIFGNENENNESDSHFDEYKNELNELNLKSVTDLENLVKPLIKSATRLDIQSATQLSSESTQLESHFGGHPYFEQGESWPKSKSGKDLDFIFQVFNTSIPTLPKDIKLIQFFYDWEEMPWDTENDGWLVKIYKNVSQENTKFIDKPDGLKESPFCKIDFKSILTLPDWEGIDVHDSYAYKLSCVLNEDEPWDNYDQVVTKLIGEQNYQSQFGGYPKWVQSSFAPKNDEDALMPLLFQIDSEKNAGLMWGDVGMVYVFYDEKSEKTEFTLQCH